jgi:hypothetical protein
MSDDASLIERKKAQSGKVSYSEPVVLHKSREMTIELIPYSIPHSDREEFAGTLKVTHRNPLKNKDREISLDPAALQMLTETLNKLSPVMTAGAEGTYVAFQVADGSVLTKQEPEVLSKAIGGLISQPEVIELLKEGRLALNVSEAVRSALRLGEMKAALCELQALLDSGVVDEAAYQEWCGRHSWSFGVEYLSRDDVRAITTGDKIDLLLPRIVSGYREIIELKRPNEDVLLWDDTHRNFFFAAGVSRAIGQVHRYLDMLADFARHGLLDAQEIVAYHPSATIVIGRSTDWAKEQHRALHGLNARLNRIEVITYDYLLSRARRLLEVVA